MQASASFAEMGFILLLSLLGFLNLMAIEKALGRLGRIFLSLPLGAAIYIVISALFLFFGISFNLLTLALAAVFEVAMVILISHRKIFRAGRSSIDWVAGFCALAISLLALLPNFSVLSYDSFAQVNLGRTIAAAEGFESSYVQERLFSWGISLPILQASASWVGLEYYHSLASCFIVSLAGLFISYLFNQYSQSKDKKAMIPSISAAIALFSSYFVAFQAQYIHNNLIASTFLFSFAYCMLITEKLERKKLQLIGLVFLVVFSLTRLENILMALIFLLPALVVFGFKPKERLWAAALFSMPVILWYGRIGLTGILTGQFETQIADPRRIFLMLAAVAFTMILMLAGLKNSIGSMLKYTPLVVAFAVILGVGIAIILRPAVVFASVRSLMLNTFIGRGNWGILWFGIAAISILSVGSKSDPGKTFIIQSTCISIALLLFFAVFRTPFRLGWGDSGNRILVHFAPLLFGAMVSKAINYEDVLRPRSIVIALFALAGAALLAVVLVFLMPNSIGNAGVDSVWVERLLASVLRYPRIALVGLGMGSIMIILAIIAKVRRWDRNSVLLAIMAIMIGFNLPTFGAINGAGPFAIRLKANDSLLSSLTDVELEKYGFDRFALTRVRKAISGRIIQISDTRPMTLLNAIGAQYLPPEPSVASFGINANYIDSNKIELGSGLAIIIGAIDGADMLIMVADPNSSGTLLLLPSPH